MTPSLKFKTASEMAQLIDSYFLYIKGEYESKKTKSTTNGKVWIREPEAPTCSGLALFLGFCNMEDFRILAQKKHYKKALSHARLRIEAAYEQLLFEKPTAAIFALKAMGWKEKPDAVASSAEHTKTLKVEITKSGPTPAGNEKEVIL